MTHPNAMRQPRKLPYLTEEELNAPIKAVKIKVIGSFTKRGEQRKEVYEDHYEAEIEVPAKYSMGHVKLGINRYVRKELHGIRARTFEVDTEFKPVQVEGRRRVKDFMSQQGLLDNESAKKLHKEKQSRLRQEQEARADGTWVPPAFQDTTLYDENGMAPLVKEPNGDA